MGWSGGTFSRSKDWTDDEANGYNIESSRMDEEDDNFAAGINACIHKGGQNAATANLPMGGYIHTGVGDGTARTNYPSIAQIQDGELVYATAGGSANALTITLAPNPNAFSTGMFIVFKASNTNTGAATVNLNAIAAKNIYVYGSPLSGGEIVSGQMYAISYNGTEFDLLNPTVPSRYGASVSRTTNTSVNSSTNVDVTFENEIADYGSFWSAGAPTRLTIPYTGLYLVTGWSAMEGGADTGVYSLQLQKNGAADGSQGVARLIGNGTTATEMYTNLSLIWYLTAADYLEFSVRQTSGSAKTLYQVYASISRL